MTNKNIIYCSDLIKALTEYISEYGDDRIVVDTETKERFSGLDEISRLIQIPDDDMDHTGYFCYLVLKKGDWEGRSF